MNWRVIYTLFHEISLAFVNLTSSTSNVTLNVQYALFCATAGSAGLCCEKQLKHICSFQCAKRFKVNKVPVKCLDTLSHSREWESVSKRLTGTVKLDKHLYLKLTFKTIPLFLIWLFVSPFDFCRESYTCGSVKQWNSVTADWVKLMLSFICQ